MHKKFIYLIISLAIIIIASLIGIFLFFKIDEEDSYFIIEIYDPDKVFLGTTLSYGSLQLEVNYYIILVLGGFIKLREFR